MRYGRLMMCGFLAGTLQAEERLAARSGAYAGMEALGEEFPFVVQVGESTLGAIVHREWILSSAHSFREYLTEGQGFFDEGGFDRDRYVPEGVALHPGYREWRRFPLRNDLALLYIPALVASGYGDFGDGFEVTDTMVVGMVSAERASELANAGSAVVGIGGAVDALSKGEWETKDCTGAVRFSDREGKVCIQLGGAFSREGGKLDGGFLLVRDGVQWALGGVFSQIVRYVAIPEVELPPDDGVFESVGWHREWIDGVMASRRELGVSVDVSNRLGEDWRCEVKGFFSQDGVVRFEEHEVPDLWRVRLGGESVDRGFQVLLDLECGMWRARE
ncbi:MAG: hypothetical protein OXH99_20620 [Bryobacterales bacterium]|nr:hypothetical protein [Bryobacterales bacterium]